MIVIAAFNNVKIDRVANKNNEVLVTNMFDATFSFKSVSTNYGHDSDDYADASAENIGRFETGKILQNEIQTKRRSANSIW